MPILPPRTLGILGGGQLGRMFTMAAREMGYEVMVLDPDPDSPAGSLASEHLCADYTDADALQRMARECAVITTEFENIPAESLQQLAAQVPVHPSAAALSVTQNRIREKRFIRDLGLPTSPFVSLQDETDLDRLDQVVYPAILKTAAFGYDGKGQIVCSNAEAARAGFAELGVACVLEQMIDLEREVSVVLGRDGKGRSRCYPLAENRHADGILDISRVPAAIDEYLADQARDAAIRIAEGLNYIGVMAVEFFVSSDGRLLVNEIAPRPHNSGHFTQDACHCSQFELQVRMVCGLPAGNLQLQTPVAMLNLLGDLWPARGEPNWGSVLEIEDACLHLYGKKEARPGRKMGHVNCLAESIDAAEALAEQVRGILKSIR